MTRPSGSLAWRDTPEFPGATVNLVSHGDSMSLTSAVTRNYLPRVAALIVANGVGVPSWTRCGINGASWNYAWPSAGYPLTMLQDARVRVDPARRNVPNWLFLLAGSNGVMLNARTAAQEYADFQTYLAASISAGWPAARTIVGTMPPRTGMSEVTRSAYNAFLVGDPSGCKLARIDLDPNIGAAGQDTNLTWFLDGTHPTDAGHAIIAQLIYNQMSFP